MLAKDAHGATNRLAPPLTIERAELDLALDTLAAVLRRRRAEVS
ncbi:hypothetical protein GCM10023169_03250 [Georgenia halophila]|uniref:Uncharacterized protein n=1 Tax=Georgenia halophila TaxID=620889 RepID=A0ABP8KV00_9MICO